MVLVSVGCRYPVVVAPLHSAWLETITKKQTTSRALMSRALQFEHNSSVEMTHRFVHIGGFIPFLLPPCSYLSSSVEMIHRFVAIGGFMAFRIPCRKIGFLVKNCIYY